MFPTKPSSAAGRGCEFAPNQYYYHTWVGYARQVAETDKARQIECLDGLVVWIPKKIIASTNDKNEILVHHKTFLAIRRQQIARLQIDPLEGLTNLDVD
jgi:hypothetical protein